MVQPVDTNEWVLKNNELVMTQSWARRTETRAEQAASKAQLDKDLAELNEGYKVWLLSTYFPGVPAIGADAIHELALSVCEAAEENMSMEESYQEIAEAFSVTLTSLGVTAAGVVNTVAPVLKPVVLPRLSSYAK